MENNLLNTDFKVNIDTSSLTDTNISSIQFDSDIREKLQGILDNEFKDSRLKRIIKKDSAGYKFACPFCHDSATDDNKKRGHIIMNGRFAGRYKCFNCGKSLNINQFFQYFKQDLSLADVSYINKVLPQSSGYETTIKNNLTANVLNREQAYEYAISRDFIRDTLQLKDISREHTSNAWNYLIDRCQYKNHERFLYSDKYNQLLILNLIDDRVLGMQIRDLTKKKYFTLTIDKLRQTLLKDTNPVPDNVAKLSCIFNIFCVDFSNTYSKPVLITEGPFDAFLMYNCIATAGASKNFGMNFPFWYIYDNDKTGKEHAMIELKEGYNVFMWKKFMEDYNIPKINPYITNGDRTKWDITDIRKYLRDNKIDKKVFWQPYFTNNILNGLYI